jgi:hypothetical protein
VANHQQCGILPLSVSGTSPLTLPGARGAGGPLIVGITPLAGPTPIAAVIRAKESA